MKRIHVVTAVALLLAWAGCGKSRFDPDSETNWLRRCAADSDCDGVARCLCGVCTVSCGAGDCSAGPPGSRCFSSENVPACEGTAEPLCLPPCGGGESCTGGSGVDCIESVCGALTESPEASSDQPSSSPDAGFDDGAPRGSDGGTFEVVGSFQPLDGWHMAIKSGLDMLERVWLVTPSNEGRSVTTWPPAPLTTMTTSTSGYHEGFGRFGPLAFDASGRFLVTIETMGDSPEFSYRLIAHDLEQGMVRASTFQVTRPPWIGRAGAQTVAVVPRDTGVTLYELIGDHFEPVGDFEDLLYQDPPGAGWFDGNPALHVGGAALLTSRAGSWERTELPEVRLPSSFKFAPDGGGVCAINIDETERRNIVITADGATTEVTGYAHHCGFSPDARYAYFSGTDLTVLTLATGVERVLAGVRPAASVGHRTFGFSVHPPGASSVFEIGWDDLTADMLLESVPFENCVPSNLRGSDSAPFVVVETWCGCTDCDDSGTFALWLDDRSVTVVEEPVDHLLHSSTFLPDGTFVLTTAGHGEADEMPDTFLVTATDRVTRRVGPIAGVPGPLHNPIARPDGVRSALCPPETKSCGGLCVTPSPGVGCGLTSCQSCPDRPDNAIPVCREGECDFDCVSPYERVGSACALDGGAQDVEAGPFGG